MHCTDGLCSIYNYLYNMLLADLDAQLELQVAEDLLDDALHFFGRDFLLGLGQRQAERHALFARAKVCAAVDMSNSSTLTSGLRPRMVSSISPQDTAFADQSQIALTGAIGAERLIAQLAVHAWTSGLVVQLAQIDVLAVLLLLGDLQLGVDLVGQLAEHAQTLAVAVDSGADAGVQPCGGLALIIKGQAETGCQSFQRALDGEEVLLGAEGTDAEGLALVGVLVDRQLLGQIDRWPSRTGGPRRCPSSGCPR